MNVVRFQEMLEALNGAGVGFIVIGGLAATVHGSPRLTQDLDIVYGRVPENLDRLVRAIAPFRLLEVRRRDCLSCSTPGL